MNKADKIGVVEDVIHAVQRLDHYEGDVLQRWRLMQAEMNLEAYEKELRKELRKT